MAIKKSDLYSSCGHLNKMETGGTDADEPVRGRLCLCVSVQRDKYVLATKW